MNIESLFNNIFSMLVFSVTNNIVMAKSTSPRERQYFKLSLTSMINALISLLNKTEIEMIDSSEKENEEILGCSAEVVDFVKQEMKDGDSAERVYQFLSSSHKKLTSHLSSIEEEEIKHIRDFIRSKRREAKKLLEKIEEI